MVTLADSPRVSALARWRAVFTTLPVWAWLVWLGCTAAALDYVLGRAVAAPVVFNDERVYSGLARQAASGSPHGVLAVVRSGYGVVYPLLLSPLYAAFASLPVAYEAAKVLNAALIASAVVPAFFLARRVLSRRWALLVTALSVFGPQAIFGALVMSENAAFPAFLWTVLGIARMLEAPTGRRQAVALASVAFCVATRMQAAAFVPGLIVAVAVFVAAEGRAGLPRRLGAFMPTFVMLGVGLGVVVAAAAVRGEAAGLFGSYGVLVQGYSPWLTARWLLANVADIDVLVGFGLFALAPISLARGLRGPTATRSSRAIAATFVGLGSMSLLMVAAFSGSSEGQYRVHERYLIYFVPVLLVVCFRWLAVDRGGKRWLLAVGAGLAVLLPVALPLQRMVALSWVDSFAAQLWLNKVIPAGQARFFCVGVAGIVVAAAFLVPRRRLGIVIVTPLLLTLFLAFASVQAHAHKNGRSVVEPSDWIDRAVGSSARVDAVFVARPCLTPHQRELRWIRMWRAEFFNRSVRLAYFVGRPLPGDLSSLRLTPGADRAVQVGRLGTSPRYLLVQPHVVAAGSVVATAPDGQLTLVRAASPARIELPPARVLFGCRGAKT